ncbi:hypothetical protein [Clostridium perfringens]|uniref:hypothetical protein n=3 Tax=Clostridium perfringens TaxID=1502 RepID=UPI001ABBB6D0|nr:hypothetical protein [Clostridium perfringens]ELC8464944.1 hypothetical protein [Clostridium perfringens]MBO3311653.1 hypothetical protein [Clostridium perfringens]MBO3378451.1 hypothetical protein [Clostridium perfringens]MDK0798456.1 hypothetical protein [Clostridium perfringens]MDM0556245.1 hypothetical protein [Clostridium perfringens]
MLYYEKKVKEILSIFLKYENGEISLEELEEFKVRTKNENIKFGLTIEPDDNYNFLLYEKYWILLINILNNKIDKKSLNQIINFIKAEEFIEKIKCEEKDFDVEFVKKINKPLIYIDNNIYISMKKSINLEDLNDDIQFVYSPAHLEELANSIRNNNFEYNEYIDKDLKFLSDLTNNFEFLPSENDGIVLCKELPKYPLKRVIKYYEGTILSEKLEKEFLEKRELIRKELALKLTTKDIKGVLKSQEGKKLLEKKEWYKEYESIGDKTIFWEKYKNDYNFLFNSINGIVEILEILDNSPESSRKYRSHLHDTSHIIYATQSDIFVTNDRRLSDKMTEIVDFLGLQTKILDYKTFIEIYFS